MLFRKYFIAKKHRNSAEIEEVTEAIVESQGEIMMVGERLEEKGFKIFRLLAVLVFLLLASRVFYLQIVQGRHYADLAKENRIRYVDIKAPRGLIFDRNGKSLVRNIPSFDAIAVPADLPKDSTQRRTAEHEVAKILGMNDQSLEALVESQDFDTMKPVLIKENINDDEALIFAERKNKLKGFRLDQTAVRGYEDGPCFSSVVGYTGKITGEEFKKYSDYLLTDYVGKTGLEVSYEKYLRGINGKQKVEVDSSGNVKKELGTDNPIKGSDLTLGIDADLQEKIKESLEKNLEQNGMRTASAVAVNPKNGEVLAMVNLPSYDNNSFARGISSDEYHNIISDPDKPMFNRAVSGEYPPGSTFKPLVAAAALQEGTITSETSINCPPAIHIGSYTFPDWKTHGVTDTRKAIAESVDIFFYALGGGYDNVEGLGIDTIKKYANMFGLGSPSGIDIPGEASGLIPDQAWKKERFGEKWYIGDDYHCAIGQGFVTATPLQLVNYTAAIANGGTLYKPHIVAAIRKTDGSEEKIEPAIMGKVSVSPSNLEIVREGMRQTITSGTAQQLKDLKTAVAGKTGTAQFGTEGKTHGWLTSFAPYDNPEIAMVVLAEGGGEGHSTAVPVTKEVYKWYFEERNK